MTTNDATEKIRGHCSLCTCWCPIIAHVKNGVFVGVSPDREHPLDLPPKKESSYSVRN